MQAWERARDLLRTAMPVIVHDDERAWQSAAAAGPKADAEVKLFWTSIVPGSGAPDSCAIAALGAMENKGFELDRYDDVLDAGFAAIARDDMEALQVAHMRLWRILRSARAIPSHPSRRTTRYAEWLSFDAATAWPARVEGVAASDGFASAIRAGWLGQIVGAAAGTALEGYTASRLAEAFGAVTSYVRPPNTLNDDITYELCFLEAFAECGPEVTSSDIAERWIGLVPFGWSAEAVALDQLRRGIAPPDSGRRDNPFDEWIGAQMRGAICGMVAPGDAREAARLAWLDAVISHAGNGILGEVFNAVLSACAFVEPDIRTLVAETVGLFGVETEFGDVLHFALDACRRSETWQNAWLLCDRRLVQYHWIHAYPNVAAQLVALWFGAESFDLTLQIVCGVGHDVDCNAAQSLCAYAIARGERAIDRRWIEPLGSEIVTYMRRPAGMELETLVGQTVSAARRWSH